jgi:hypothetical protein
MLARLVPIALAALFLVAGCEKTDHATIDKWMGTKKGPAKLKKTLVDDSLDPDLSAHAAANMIKKGRDQEVKTELDNMSEPRRQAIVAKLAPRLWEMARIEGEMMMPAPQQVQAKDALVVIRKYADTPVRTTIDGYLIDWYTVPSYEGRAKAGAILGATVMRTVGPAAGKKLMRVTDGIIAAPGQEQTKKRIGDELLLGMAATGDPDAVKYILDIAKLDRGDETLSKRAMGALYTAYVDPQGLFDLQEPGALVPNLDQLVSIAKDDAVDPAAANSAVALIRVVGPPQCLPPLVSMIAHPHADPRFRYFGPDAALKCGGVKAIKEVVRAMPDQAYEKVKLEGTVVLDISKMNPREQVLAELRDLLNDKSRMARWIAIETLAAMKSKEDAVRIGQVKGNEKLIGFWWDQSGTDPAARKSDPTLGQRAKELSEAVQKTP